MNYRRLPTDSRRPRPPSILAAALAFSLAAAACGSSAPTAIIIYATPTPAPVTPTPEPMPTPTATPTPAFTPTPGPSDAATPTPPTAATPTPAVTSTPGSTGPAGACSGGINVQHFFADTAAAASFDVYCGVVSKPWFFDASTYTAEGLDIIYCTQTNSGHTCPSGPKIELKEGPFPTYGSIGPGSFGNLSGQLYSVSGGGFLIYVSPGTEKSYLAIGSGGVSQATFVNIVKALVKVPKS